ncbi:MAG: MTH1187 family thiamine-binding protein [Spirochaetales bacterium]|nr:MTH1187 family thiamine-binding protein [Spirochaetales bacterium]
MPVMEISVVPLGTKSASVSSYVAAAVRVLQREKGLTYEVCPMGTVIEAPSVKKLLAVAEKMHKTVLSGKIKRVVTSIKIDERRDKKLSMRGKMQSVEEKLAGKSTAR